MKSVNTNRAFCLMPNHVHLLMQSSVHPLAKCMQGVQQSYTRYFNQRYKKTRHLFEGRYKAILCQEEPYLLQLIRYIHLNPVRAGMAKSPEHYAHSGHYAYAQRKRTEIVEPALVLGLLGGSRGYQKFVRDGIQDGHQEECYAVADQRFLGDQKFNEAMGAEDELELARPKGKSRIDGAARLLAKYLDIEVQVLQGADRSWEASRARKQIAYALVRRMGYRLKDVAGYFGRDAATVATLLARLTERLESDPQEKRKIEHLGKIVKS